MPKQYKPATYVNAAKHPTITLEPVTSSLLHSIGYDPDTKTAAATFKAAGGGQSRVYQYAGVTPGEFEAWKTAKSVGQHFNTHIAPTCDALCMVPKDEWLKDHPEDAE